MMNYMLDRLKRTTLPVDMANEPVEVMDSMDEYYVPIWFKLAMTKEEAAKYSNIGINKIDSMLKEPRCPFVLYVGKKKLVKRKEFEEFISKNIEI